MYSKEEGKQLAKDFWIAFAEAYPRKWILHRTKVKDYAFKFYTDNKKIAVILELSMKDEEKRNIYYEKLESMKTILLEDYIPDAIFERSHINEHYNEVSRVYCLKENISFHNKNNWPEIFEYFHDRMSSFEYFFYENEDYLKDLDVNT